MSVRKPAELPDDTMAVALALLRPCPSINPAQRARGVVCAMFANGTDCLGGGECSEAEGGRWVVTDVLVKPDTEGLNFVWYEDPDG